MIKTVGSVELDVSSGSDNIPAVSHERFVMSDELHWVLQLPTVTTEVLETGQVPEIKKVKLRILAKEDKKSRDVLQQRN